MAEPDGSRAGTEDVDPHTALVMAAVILPAILVLGVVLYEMVPMNRDAALHVWAAEQIWAGRWPYEDVIGTNPPMMDFVHLPVTVLDWLPFVDAGRAIDLYALAFTAFGLIGLASLTDRERDGLEPLDLAAIGGAWLAFWFYQYTIWEWAEREQLWVSAWVPWLLVRLRRHQQRDVPLGWWVAVGVLLPPMCLMKPHWLAAVALTELWLLLRSQRWRATFATPEAWMLVGWGLAYLVYLLTMSAEATEVFFGKVVPFLRETYGAYKQPTIAWIDDVTTWAPLEMSVVMLVLRGRLPERDRLAVEMWTVATLVAWGGFLQQGQGYYYHRIPANALALVGVGWTVLRLLQAEDARLALWGRGLLAAVTVLGTLHMAPTLLGTSKSTWESVESLARPVREHLGAGDRYVIIHPGTYPTFPVIHYLPGEWGSRWMVAYPISEPYVDVEAPEEGPFPYHGPDELNVYERWYLDDLAADLDTFAPDVLIIPSEDPHLLGFPVGFQIEAYLQASGFVEAHMGDYERVDTFERFDPMRWAPETWAVWTRR